MNKSDSLYTLYRTKVQIFVFIVKNSSGEVIYFFLKKICAVSLRLSPQECTSVVFKLRIFFSKTKNHGEIYTRLGLKFETHTYFVNIPEFQLPKEKTNENLSIIKTKCKQNTYVNKT